MQFPMADPNQSQIDESNIGTNRLTPDRDGISLTEIVIETRSQF